MSPVTVRFRKVLPDARTPTYATPGAAGLDLHSARETPLTIYPEGRACIPTGIAMEIPPGFEGQVRPRSGLALKYGVATFLGTIDSDYRGEIGVTLVNYGSMAFVVEPGDRIAQLVIAPVVHARLVEATELGDTERGAGGFGSTGR
jgi:dUTP pyrophosphatase